MSEHRAALVKIVAASGGCGSGMADAAVVVEAVLAGGEWTPKPEPKWEAYKADADIWEALPPMRGTNGLVRFNGTNAGNECRAYVAQKNGETQPASPAALPPEVVRVLDAAPSMADMNRRAIHQHKERDGCFQCQFVAAVEALPDPLPIRTEAEVWNAAIEAAKARMVGDAAMMTGYAYCPDLRDALDRLKKGARGGVS